jgi:hypothetical protein
MLYLISAAAAGVPLIYVPGKLIIADNATATADKVLTFEVPFRICMVSELTGAILLLFVVRILYQLLNEIDKGQASLMVTFVLISVPITFLNVLNDVAVLALLHGGTFLSVFNGAQRNALALMFLGLHAAGANLANIFWGLWLFPFGSLVLRSRLFPRVLGALLILNGCALIAVSLTQLLLPAYSDLVARLAIVPELGELWMMVWLIVKGVRVPQDKRLDHRGMSE